MLISNVSINLKGAIMKKALFYFLIIAFCTTSLSPTLYSQITIKKQVIVSGGFVGTSNGDVRMSGAFGQTIIGKRSIMQGELEVGTVVHQGFWVPEGLITSVDDPVFTYNSQITNYPNPVHNVTTFKYNLESSAFVTLRIIDMVGNQIIAFQDEYQMQGEHTFQWYARNSQGLDLPSGSYIYELLVQPAERSGATIGSPYSLRNVMVIVK
jgi:hypothetical protein